jgi:membrane protein implicated in regulation of membrane protease activity
MVTPDSARGLAALSAAVLVGMVLLLAGAGTLMALLVFPGAALAPGTPMASYPYWAQVLMAATVLAVGLGLAGVPIGRRLLRMYRVRAEAEKEGGEGGR